MDLIDPTSAARRERWRFKRSRRWRPVRWLQLVTRRGWRWQGGLLVSPRGTKYQFRHGWARLHLDWWEQAQ